MLERVNSGPHKEFQFCISHIVDIGRYQLSLSTFGIFLLERSLPVRPHPALRCMHACNAIALSRSCRGQQAQHDFLISLHRRPILFFLFSSSSFYFIIQFCLTANTRHQSANVCAVNTHAYFEVKYR